MNLFHFNEYFICKKNKKEVKYNYEDFFSFNSDDGFEYLSIRKNNHIIGHYSYSEIDDWYADIGTITHRETYEVDFGKLISYK